MIDFGDVLGFGGQMYASRQEAKAAAEAARIQAEVAREGIAEQRRQYDTGSALLNPYVQAGYEALGYSPDQINTFQPPAPVEAPGIGEQAPSQEAYSTPRALQEQLPIYTPQEAFTGGPRPEIRNRNVYQESVIRQIMNAGGGIEAVPPQMKGLARQLMAQEAWDARKAEYDRSVAAQGGGETERTKPGFWNEGDTPPVQYQSMPTGIRPDSDSYNPNPEFQSPNQTGVNLRTFQGGVGRANPILDALTQAGARAVPQIQNFAETGARQTSPLEGYVGAGQNALQMQQALAGTLGPEAQQAAYQQVRI